MDDWSRTFLGVIALSAIVQAVFLIGAAVAGIRLSRRLAAIEERFESQLRPGIEQMNRVTGNLAELSELARTQGERLRAVLDDTTEKVRETTDYLRMVIARSTAPLVQVGAFWSGLRRGIGMLRGDGFRRDPYASIGARTGRDTERERRRDVWEGQRRDLPLG
jgi:hypothetical protein